MKEFYFMYNGTDFRYKDGSIEKLRGVDHWEYFCPVHVDLHSKLEDLYLDQRHTILEAVVHAYSFGFREGKIEKAKELRRALDID